MTKKQTTLLYYHVPQDRDDPQSPNVFGIGQSKQNLRVHHIREQFPLKGTYVFRFKVSYENMLAWLDVPDPNARPPTFRDKVIVKATRVSWDQEPIQHFINTAAKEAPPQPNPSKPVKEVDFFQSDRVHQNFNLLESPDKNKKLGQTQLL